MRKHVVATNFHVVVSQGDDKPGRKVEFSKGQVLEDKDLPEGHSFTDWAAKGLVAAPPETFSHDDSAA